MTRLMLFLATLCVVLLLPATAGARGFTATSESPGVSQELYYNPSTGWYVYSGVADDQNGLCNEVFFQKKVPGEIRDERWKTTVPGFGLCANVLSGPEAPEESGPFEWYLSEKLSRDDHKRVNKLYRASTLRVLGRTKGEDFETRITLRP